MKKVSFNNVVTVKYYSVDKKKKIFLERYFLILLSLVISLVFLYLYL